MSPYFFDIPEPKKWGKRSDMLAAQNVPCESFFQVSQNNASQCRHTKTRQIQQRSQNPSEYLSHTSLDGSELSTQSFLEHVLSLFLPMHLTGLWASKIKNHCRTYQSLSLPKYSDVSCHAWFTSHLTRDLSISATSWASESSLQATNSSFRNREGVVYLSCSL